MNPCPTCKDVPLVDAMYCPTCSGKGFLVPPSKPRVTKENYSKLVADGEVSISEYDATVRVRLTFRTGKKWGVIFSQHLLNTPHVVLQDEVIMLLNEADLGSAEYDLLAGFPTKYEAPSGYQGLVNDGYVGASGGKWNTFWNKSKPTPQPPDGRKIVTDLRRLLPGLDTVLQCPAKRQVVGASTALGRGFGDDRCNYKNTLQAMIVHLNDSDHRWPREDLADWLESLDVDLTFPTDTDDLPEPPPLPVPQASPMAQVVKDIYAKQLDSYLNNDLIKHIYAAQGDATVKFQVKKNGSNPLLDEMWKVEQGGLMKMLEEHSKPCPTPPKTTPWAEHVKAMEKLLAGSMQSPTFITGDWDLDCCASDTPAPPSPLAAKKAHDDQQAELLAKLNKPKKKGGK